MTTQEVIDYYGDQGSAANALGIYSSAISQWGDEPPALRQLQLERMTKGALIASKDCLIKSALK